MYYEAGDFLETADNDTLKRIARIRELTREYYFSDYEIGIVTSKTREEFAHDFCQSGISHYFKTIICAENTGIDFALAVWGSHSKHIKADYFLERPADLLSAIT